MKKIDLVFRTVGERTATASLELAQKNIQPHKVHIIENVIVSSKVGKLVKMNQGSFSLYCR